MSSREGTPYVIREDSADEDGWVAPEPADEVIAADIVAATDLEADDLDHLAAYVDMSTLAAVVDGARAEVTFTVEGYEVIVTSAAEVSINDA